MIEVEKEIQKYRIVWVIKGTNILHREDGPAVEWNDGRKDWWLNGMCHREDGPATVWPDGAKNWWINGKLHRADGPAIVYADGHAEWCINGILFKTKEEWFESLVEEQKTKALYSEYFIRG